MPGEHQSDDQSSGISTSCRYVVFILFMYFILHFAFSIIIFTWSIIWNFRIYIIHALTYDDCFISVPPNIIDEESTLSSVAVRENLNLTLTCKAKGFPEPKITWKREDGNDIVLDRKKKG